MAGYELLAAEVRRISESTATDRSVAQKALDKTALGHDFRAHNITVTQALADDNGETLIRHNPPDGDTIRLMQNSADNNLQIQNESSGNISAWFYPNGKAWINLDDESVFGAQIAADQLDTVHFVAESVDETILAGASVINSKYATASISTGKIQTDAITYSLMNDNTKNQGTGTSSMRTIGSGSSSSAAGSNHTHLSINFNAMYTLTEKENSANLVTSVRSMTVQPQLEALRHLVLDMAHQLMDEPDHDVVEKVRRIKEDSTYAHEFRMKHDSGYFAAFMFENNPRYAEVMGEEQAILQMAANARSHYGTIENRPDIVEETRRRYPKEFEVA